MAFKSCKYGCNTEIQWDTQLNAFRESEGRLHDRKRCEELRPANKTNQSSPQQQQQQQQQPPQQAQPQQQSLQQQQQQQQQESPERIEKLLSGQSTLTSQVSRLSELYGDLVEQLQALSTTDQKVFLIVDKVEQFLEQARITDAKVDRLLAAYTHSQLQEQSRVDAEVQYDNDRESGLV